MTQGSFTTCSNCHAGAGGEFEAGTDNSGVPELNGYGSPDWLREFIRDPGSAQFYGDKNKMPAFAEKLSPRELDLLVRFLTGDYLDSAGSEHE